MRKIVIVLTLILASLVAVFGQDFNNNVTFKKRTHLKGRTVVLDTCLTIRSGNDSVVIALRKDSVFVTSSTAGFVFTPPLAFKAPVCEYDTVIQLDSSFLLHASTPVLKLPALGSGKVYLFNTCIAKMVNANTPYGTNAPQTGISICIGDSITPGPSPNNSVFRVLAAVLRDTTGTNYTLGFNSGNGIMEPGKGVIIGTSDATDLTDGDGSLRLTFKYKIIELSTGKEVCR